MNYFRLIISLALPQLAGALGAVFTSSAIPAWYASLTKPAFSPPNWLFGPVWLSLYLMMGLSVYLIWQKIDKNEKAAGMVRLFWVHLFFNAIWSPIFFGLKNPGLALADILLILALIVLLIIKFRPIDQRAAYLLVPYLAWVGFATSLNFFIWRLN